LIVRRVVVGVLVAGLSVGPAMDARAQAQAPTAAAPTAATGTVPPRPASTVNVDELPISVNRIGRNLGRPATLSLELAQPMFRVEIVESRPRWLGDIEWVPAEDRAMPHASGPAWHRDFLAMVTPQQARPFGQVQGFDLLQLVASSFAQGVATNMVVGKIKKAVERRRASKVRAEVDAAIDAWKRDRQGATDRAPASDQRFPATPPVPPR
jgi:hypothetical protein